MQMSYDRQLSKHGTDKIFLLALFAFSLLLAHLVVRVKKVILLGEPIKIAGMGVSIRLPNGNGWRSDSQWRHDENTLVLHSIFRPGPGPGLADVNCVYRLTSFRHSGYTWLEQYAKKLDAVKPEYGTNQIETVALEWVYLKPEPNRADRLAATTKLGYGRWLDIEIMSAETEDGLVMDVFEKIAANIVVKDNELLGRGIEIVSRIKEKGLDKVMLQSDEPYYYLMKDSGQRDVGFTVEMLLESNNTDRTEIQAADFGYITRPNRWESAMLLKGTPNLEEYVWESETERDRIVRITRGELTIQAREQNIRISARISVSDGNEISVHRLGPEQMEFEAGISKAAIPGAVIEAVYIQMVNSDVNKAVVDVILSDGQIKPALITVRKVSGGGSPFTHIVKANYLGSNEMDETYFDSRMHVVKGVLRRSGVILVMEPVELEDLVRRFPERADYILQRSRAIKQGRL
jgi:hypothetical protein